MTKLLGRDCGFFVFLRTFIYKLVADYNLWLADALLLANASSVWEMNASVQIRNVVDIHTVIEIKFWIRKQLNSFGHYANTTDFCIIKSSLKHLDKYRPPHVYFAFLTKYCFPSLWLFIKYRKNHLLFGFCLKI